MLLASFSKDEEQLFLYERKASFFIDILRNKNRKIENAFQYCQMSTYDKYNRQVDVLPMSWHK